MRITRNWLREFADVDLDAGALSELLSDLGLEVEDVRPVGEVPEGVVVARVLDVRPHPDADRIRLVDVDPGDGGPLQICCGASNMSVGDLVALATVGTTMPDGMSIAARRMRGEESNGMLCSSRELGLGEDHDGILILQPGPLPGTALGPALGLESDLVVEVDVLPNRPDASPPASGSPSMSPDLTRSWWTGIWTGPRCRSRTPGSAVGSPSACSTTSRSARPRRGWRRDSRLRGCGRSTSWSTPRTT